MSFDQEADAVNLVEMAQSKIGKAVIINAGLPNEEGSFCKYERCYHDESPSKPCVEISKTELKSGV